MLSTTRHRSPGGKDQGSAESLVEFVDPLRRRENARVVEKTQRTALPFPERHHTRQTIGRGHLLPDDGVAFTLSTALGLDRAAVELIGGR